MFTFNFIMNYLCMHRNRPSANASQRWNPERHKFGACRASRYVRTLSVNDGVCDGIDDNFDSSPQNRYVAASSTNPNAGKTFVYFKVIRDTEGQLMQTNLRSLHCDGKVKWPQVMGNSRPFQMEKFRKSCSKPCNSHNGMERNELIIMYLQFIQHYVCRPMSWLRATKLLT